MLTDCSHALADIDGDFLARGLAIFDARHRRKFAITVNVDKARHAM